MKFAFEIAQVMFSIIIVFTKENKRFIHSFIHEPWVKTD